MSEDDTAVPEEEVGSPKDDTSSTVSSSVAVAVVGNPRKSSSARKSKGGTSGWMSCSKCQRRLPRNICGKHVDAGCDISVIPFIHQGILHANLKKATVASGIQNLPFVNVFRYSSSTLFLPEELIKECRLKTFSWATVTTSEQKSIAVRIWPTPDSIGSTTTSNLNALMSKDGFLANHLSEQTIRISPLPSSLTLPLKSVLIEVDDVNASIDSVTFDTLRFAKDVKSALNGRLIKNQNVFRVRYYAEVITFSVINIEPVVNLEDTFKNLSITQEQFNPADCFGEFVDDTEIDVRFKSKFEFQKGELSLGVCLEDIGGLDGALKELQATIKFILSTDLKVAKGIILYGHSGTGKSFVIQALCNHFNLSQVSFDEFQQNNSSLTKVFRDAISKSPSAIIIDNIDSLAPSKSSDAPITNFSSNLQSLISSLPKSKQIVILATATNVDVVDQQLRSPQIFGKEIELPVPSRPEREEILKKMLTKINHSLTKENILDIAGSTHGFVGADLYGLCTQGIQVAVERQISGNSQTAVVQIQDLLTCMKSVKPSAAKSILVDVPNVRWDDIGGQTKLKFDLKQAIEWPLKHPEAFRRLGITPPKGILMYGPPGCSKTMIAKAIATESGLNFISVKGSELFSKWVGESEKAVRDIFRKARQVAPCVVFFDEIDSLGGERGATSGSSNVHERVLAQLLVEMDGIEPLKDVTIVAATNRPDIIDQALLRPGRLDRIIYVPLPDAETRKEILKIRLRKMPISPSVNLERIVEATEHYSGAELTALSQEAAMKALEEDIDCNVILERHFLQALDIVKPRIAKEQIIFYENYNSSRTS